MIIGKKTRDVKFIIYQSLYILVIAMLGAKHVTINDIPDPLPPDMVQISIRELDSLRKLPTYDADSKLVLEKPKEQLEYRLVSAEDTIISIETIKSKDMTISQLQKQIPASRPPAPVTPEPTPGANIKGIRPGNQ